MATGGALLAGVAVGAAGSGRAQQSRRTAWTQPGFDDRNSGHNPDARVPNGDVQILWRTQSRGGHQTGAVVTEDVVYFGTAGGVIQAVDRLEGNHRWSERLVDQRDSGMDAPPALVDGTLYVGSKEAVHAVEADSGQQRWRKPAQVEALAPVVVEDGNVYHVDGSLRARDAESGEEQWSYDGGLLLDSGPALSGGRLFVGDNDGAVHAVRADDGSRVWTHEVAEGVRATPTVVDDTVVVGDMGGNVYGLAAGSGEPRWQYEERSDRATIRYSAAAMDGTVFVPYRRGERLAAFDARTGREQWRYTDIERDGIRAAPAVADGTVVLTDGGLHAVDAETGEAVWTFEIGQFKKSAPTVVDGVIYVGNWDDNFYALSNEELAPTPSRTPTETASDGDGPTETRTTTRATQEPADTATRTTAGSETTAAATSSQAPRRGFFSNGAEGEPAFLSDITNLTVLGFLLSVAGIVHQMLGGR